MPGERLAGKVAIVTGAGSRVPGGIGNGRATAVLFAREGARVALVDTNKEWVDETLDMIQREDGQAFVILADVTDPPPSQGIGQQTVDRWCGRVPDHTPHLPDRHRLEGCANTEDSRHAGESPWAGFAV